MFDYVSAVGIAAVVATVLMVVAMLYLVWGAMGNDTHRPSREDDERPELAEDEESTETQGELAADGNSA
ncbi:hypothetical protein GJ633_06390 [Halorubrum sp. CBA1125]|uniref:hypothetical protein n=1 Tax=Halorubrum sp. CBA1125 TaxID=2668072 RepID=UPI0012E7E7CD|nr:hypothetical protein [Halorubrum sp. CBA1125]MUW14327.1 hypothetical protein [Halorubrum sp. CBA1125]